MKDLHQRIADAINEGRDNAAKRAENLDFYSGDSNIVFLAGWINGVEDALTEIANEIEALTARLDAHAPMTDND